jgi:hypothetical protein
MGFHKGGGQGGSHSHDEKVPAHATGNDLTQNFDVCISASIRIKCQRSAL